MDEALLKKVVGLTGLPEESVTETLKDWIQSSGKSPQDLNLEDLREVLVPILQNLFCEVASGDNEYLNLSD